MKLGIAIWKLRKEQGKKQADLSKLTGLSQTSLSQIENSKKNPSQSSIKKICKALEVGEAALYLNAMEETDFPEGMGYDLIQLAIKSLEK